MRFLLCSLLIVSLYACRSEYSTLKPFADPERNCEKRVVPRAMTTSWYDAAVDVYGRHISGLLLIKQMPDSAYRTVFMNEAGVTYFDFAWDKDARFTPHHVIHQLDKGPVIQTLRKDFELLIGFPFRGATPTPLTMGDRVYFGVKQKKETAYFITGQDCASLQGLELGSKRKKKVSVSLHGAALNTPDSVMLQHHTFDMRISLKKIERE